MTRVATRLSTAPAATSLPAEDLKRARAFYEEKLGLETETRDDMPEGVFVHAGKGTQLFLYRRGRATAQNTAVVFEVDDVMLSGDVLFAGSIGRTDLPGGDHAAMIESLKRVILPAPDDMTVLPGHGGQTTIGVERATNPYLRPLAENAEAGVPRRTTGL